MWLRALDRDAAVRHAPTGVKPNQRAELLGRLRSPQRRVAGGAESVAGRRHPAVREDLDETLDAVLPHARNIGSEPRFREPQ